MTMTPGTSEHEREDRIRALAYRLWEEDGQPEGMAEEHWRRAAEIIEAEETEGAATAGPDWLKRGEAFHTSAPGTPDLPPQSSAQASGRIKQSAAK